MNVHQQQSKRNAHGFITESRLAHVNLQNEELEQVLTRLNTVLTDALAVQHFLDVQILKSPLPNPVFTPGPLAIAEPPPAPYLYQPPAPTGLPKAASWRQRKVCTGDCKSTGNL